MINQVFLDTNVILDFLLNRKRFVKDAAKLFQLAQQNKLDIYVSATSVSAVYYIASRSTNKVNVLNALRQLLPLTKVLPVGPTTIEKALLANFKDFEDAIQNFCAVEGGLNSIITRDVKDFSKSRLSIQTPKEYLTMIRE